MISGYAKLRYMHKLVQQLNPANQPHVTWNYHDTDQLVPEDIVRVTEQFNATPYSILVEPLRAAITADSNTGIRYILQKKSTDSRTSAIVHFNPFANDLTDNMLLRAEYLHRVFRLHGMESLPLFSFAAPSSNPGIRFTHKHRRHAARGNFAPMADRYLSVIASWGYTELRIIGFSQGATLAAAVAARAARHGIAVTHLAIGEPANVIKRSRRQLGKDFKVSTAHLNDAIDASGIHHMKQFYFNNSTTAYLRDLAKQARLNMSVTGGLGKPTLVHDVHQALQAGVSVTMSWGDMNVISPASTLRPLVEAQRNDGHSIHSVEIADGDHAWADRINLLALFYTYALLR